MALPGNLYDIYSRLMKYFSSAPTEHDPIYLILTPSVLTINSLWPGGLVKVGHFNTILTSPKSWLSQEDLDAGCEHSLVPMDSYGL